VQGPLAGSPGARAPSLARPGSGRSGERLVTWDRAPSHGAPLHLARARRQCKRHFDADPRLRPAPRGAARGRG